MNLLAPQPITLSAATPIIQSPFISVDKLTDAITIQFQRPTTLVPLDWDSASTFRVTIIFRIDGVEHRCQSTFTGGVKVGTGGREIAVASLTYSPTVQFGSRATEFIRTAIKDAEGFYNNVPLTRIGEDGTTVEGAIRLERLSGTIETSVLIAVTTESAAPKIRHKNSVAFDASTDAQEVGGDGVITLSHTPAGSTDLGAFAAQGHSAGIGGQLGSATYDGSAMTEMWDAVFDTNFGHGGYQKISIPTGTRNVVSTLLGSPDEFAFGVITMTGVHQATPVGTPATTTAVAANVSTTSSDAATDDLVVDSLYKGSTSVPTIGADQTSRNTEASIGSFSSFHQSTQPGSAGGVMSWTFASASHGHGTVAFKPSAASNLLAWIMG